MNMLYVGFRSDDEEETEDEDAAIGDDALDEMGEVFTEDELDDTADPLVAGVDEDDEDEEDVDFDTHDDVEKI
jgi:hypothetical protein